MNLRLKKLRIKLGVSRREVAIAVGITEATLFNYETGITIPNLTTAAQLADYYSCSIDELLGRTDKSSITK